MNRRNLLKTVGGIGAAGAIGGPGLLALSGGAAASDISIVSTNPDTLQNDQGDLTRVTVDPELEFHWSGFDEAVGAVFWALEAKTEGMEEYYPVYRETPWLDPQRAINGGSHVSYGRPHTSGQLVQESPLSTIISEAENAREEELNPADDDPEGIVIASEYGRPPYGEALSESEMDNYLGGNSVGNHYRTMMAYVEGNTPPGRNYLRNGLYGAATDTSAFDEPVDGESNTTRVDLRYTVEFLEVSLGQFKVWTGYDVLDNAEDNTPSAVREELESLYDHAEQAWDSEALDNAEWLTNVHPGDITIYAGANGTVDSWQIWTHLPPMNGEEYVDVGTAGGGEYASTTRDLDQLQAAASGTPAIIVEETQFAVTVQNTVSTSGSTGNSNAGSE